MFGETPYRITSSLSIILNLSMPEGGCQGTIQGKLRLDILKPVTADVGKFSLKFIIHDLDEFVQRIFPTARPAAQINPPSGPVNMEGILTL
jgi:hypothetical protein